ncbi:hypothetical protein TI39_contig4170g00004 [Zymoseptoria brevis]|uniref:U three protein 23 n=1 Tax=Zymoseptoria brevis TaxID=1047168 RepID=A0A0F4GBC1_9PEZI|nr:hypothetical protein TI39_contig4170g00004 [Zymoseptoria brevis]
MRGKRSKQYRKLMQQYQLNFSFREPYQVLLDSGIITSGSAFKMSLGHMLSSTLHGEIKPMITQCSIRHLYNAPASPTKDQCIEVAKQAERRRCGHHELEQPLSEFECIMSVVDPKGSGTNRHRYVVASQLDEVRKALRKVVGTPLVYVKRSVMVLEPMAQATEEVREREEKSKIRAGLVGRRETGGGEKRKRGEDDQQDGEERQEKVEAKKRKVKGPKGPNPLSAKKAKSGKAEEKEGEKAALRKVMKKDPQAAEKAGLTIGGAGNGEGGGDVTKKRKRKRKPKESGVDGASEAGGDE